MDDDETFALFEQLADVRVITCPDCEGTGKLTQGLDMICPRCRGCGKTTKHTRRETSDERAT